MSKLAGGYNRDLTKDEKEKCKKDSITFVGDNCVEKALDLCLKLKREEYKDKKGKVLEYNLQLHAHNGSGFDTWIVLYNLPCDKRIVNIIKNGKGLIELKVFNGYIKSKTSRKQIPQYLHFRCGMTHLNYSLKKLGKTFNLQKELLKTETNHDEVDGNKNKNKIDEWLPYVKNNVLCTVFSYARYIKAMQEKTGFPLKDCLSLPGLGLKYFNSLRTEEDEPIYTYNDKHMKWFVRKTAYECRVCAFNQYYKSRICDEILKITTKELCVKGNDYDIIEAYMKYKNKHFKMFEKDFEGQFNDYGHENIEAKERFINEKLSNLRLHKILKRRELVHLLWDFDAVSLYPSAMWDPKSIYPKIETGYSFKREMIYELVEKLNTQTFTQGSAILKIKHYSPKNLLVQHLPC